MKKKRSTKDLIDSSFFEDIIAPKEEENKDISPAEADIEEREREEEPKKSINDPEELFDRSLNEKMFQTPTTPENTQDALAELEQLLNMRRKK